MLLKIEPSGITPVFYNNFFRFGGGGGISPPSPPGYALVSGTSKCMSKGTIFRRNRLIKVLLKLGNIGMLYYSGIFVNVKEKKASRLYEELEKEEEECARMQEATYEVESVREVCAVETWDMCESEAILHVIHFVNAAGEHLTRVTTRHTVEQHELTNVPEAISVSLLPIRVQLHCVLAWWSEIHTYVLHLLYVLLV